MNENYNLHIEPILFNPVNGQFRPGHIPFNKGKKWVDYMDMRKAKKVLKCLELGRIKGSRDKLHELNRIPIVGIKDGKLYPFKSSVNAANILKAKGVKVNARNIRAVYREKIEKVGKYNYTRKKAGGFQWFIAENVNGYKNLMI